MIPIFLLLALFVFWRVTLWTEFPPDLIYNFQNIKGTYLHYTRFREETSVRIHFCYIIKYTIIITDHRPLTTDHRPPTTGDRRPATGDRPPAAGRWPLVITCFLTKPDERNWSSSSFNSFAALSIPLERIPCTAGIWSKTAENGGKRRKTVKIKWIKVHKLKNIDIIIFYLCQISEPQGTIDSRWGGCWTQKMICF